MRLMFQFTQDDLGDVVRPRIPLTDIYFIPNMDL